MYKIYINEQALILLPSNKVKAKHELNSHILLSKYYGKKKMLLNYIDMLEKGSSFQKVILHSDDYKQLKADFVSLYEIVPAGGGLVVNPKNQILFIFRRGFWDLPKGKLEGSETIKACAIREVEEETGIKDIVLKKRLLKTNHQFRRGTSRRIKESYWYLMKTEKQKLIPQTSEDITKAEWMTMEKFFSKKRPVYASILDVLTAYKKHLEKKQKPKVLSKADSSK